MSQAPTVTVVCRGAPAHCRQWYGELARLIAATASPAAALFESSSDHPRIRATVRPPEVVELLRRGVVGSGVRVDACSGRAPVPPPEMPVEGT